MELPLQHSWIGVHFCSLFTSEAVQDQFNLQNVLKLENATWGISWTTGWRIWRGVETYLFSLVSSQSVSCVLSRVRLFATPWTIAPSPGSSIRVIFHARILEWVAISSSRGSSWPRDRTQVSCVSCIGRRVPHHCATWEAPLSPLASDRRELVRLKIFTFSRIQLWLCHGSLLWMDLLGS